MNDFKISKNHIKNLEDDELIWHLIEPIWPSSEEEDTLEHISKGTAGQKAFFAVILFIREVDNGGLEQFFENSSGKYINEVITGLDLIGAHEHLDVLKKAIKIFPHSRVPTDTDKRDKLLKKQLENINKSADEHFEEFNDELYDEERLYPCLLDYFRNHEHDFIK